MDRRKLAEVLAGATPETLREDARLSENIADNLLAQVANIQYGSDDTPAVAIPVMLGNADMHNRLAALALAIAEMQERSERAIAQDPARPHVVHWSVDVNVGQADWIIGDVGANAERTLPAALAHLLTGEEG
jgi:hypothetical protein